MLPLRCAVQEYAWGKPAATSVVARLARANHEPQLDHLGNDDGDDRRFAELWMGAHANGASLTVPSGLRLDRWIDAHGDSLGDATHRRFGGALPFLFKVLSIERALSIQSHPDKARAERLHRERPDLYPDANHKPEMAVALGAGGAQALCGFRPLNELDAMLQREPEVCGAAGGVTNLPDEAALRAAFAALFAADADGSARHAVMALVQRVRDTEDAARDAHERLALRLDAQYPGGDVGVLAAFFLNIVSLREGEALTLPANEPHAYLSGDLIECMSASDNVIRAGLTPKFKHAEELCASLTYATSPPVVSAGVTRTLEGAAATVTTYRPPFEEFEVRALRVGHDDHDGHPVVVTLPPDAGPQILLVTRGVAEAVADISDSVAIDLTRTLRLACGSVAFVPAGTALTLRCVSSPFECWVAAVNAAVSATSPTTRP